MTADTSKALRRPLRFASPADALADAADLCRAFRNGELTATGNWTLAQALNHVASWMTFPFVGFPFQPPRELAERARARKPHALSNGLLPGIQIPGMQGGTVAFEDSPPEHALARLRASWDFILREQPPHPHPFFGPLSKDEWLLLQLRHSELHQGFFFPGGRRSTPENR